jgi:uncharacterized protein YndB with AHSA1/START domain
MTSSPNGTIEHTPDGGFVRFDRSLQHPIEEVWASITEPDRLADWWPPFAAKITADRRVGGRIVFEWADAAIPTLDFTITKFDPPNLLEHSHSSPASWMRWELTATEAGTQLHATYFVPEIDMAVERGDVAGLHYSLDRLEPALAGQPAAWGDDAFGKLLAEYAPASLDAGPV